MISGELLPIDQYDYEIKEVGLFVPLSTESEESGRRLQITNRYTYRIYAASMWNQLPLAIRSSHSI